MHFTLKMAGLVIGCDTVYDYTYRMSKGYISDDTEPDIYITTTEEDIAFEKEINDGQFSDGYMESLAVLRKISDIIPSHDRFLMHGSAIALDGNGIIFTAPSGTGKSTHARLYREVFGDRVTMVNDDKPFIWVRDDGICVCGTPWDGKHRLSGNICVPLKAVVSLNRGEDNIIEPMNRDESFQTMFRQCYRSPDGITLSKILGLIYRTIDDTGMYRLYCRPDEDAVRCSSKVLEDIK